MIENSEISQEDVRITELRTRFHEWKYESPITRLIFKYFKHISNQLTSSIINNALSPAPLDQKICVYYSCAAKLQLLIEIMELSLDDPELQESILKGDK